tara:strand:- start:437 stop:1213 length:777 start_codon:yes stop_codon:yes gene_type:complete
LKLVKPKKKYGQHFLNDIDIAKRIVSHLKFNNYNQAIEIGPGMGILTKFFSIKKKFFLIEIDEESVKFLKKTFHHLSDNIILADFLKLDIKSLIKNRQTAIIGNFPYNISSQIIFKLIENRNLIPFLCGLFQKEVAERICEKKGSKKYGIISVLVQVYYKPTYIFTIEPDFFKPKPKVKSGFITLKRRKKTKTLFNEELFFKIVKLSFQQRRKILRNSLKKFELDKKTLEDIIFDKRPERLSVDDFINLTKIIEDAKI